ncbi:TRAP transporter small permease [Pseudonocardia thermophila]|uniref:TRAP transporter small permease n=1 Tax=Pseudonocardia thermophila TaxID=1848 RepID=UPI000936FD46|nr:TRAP transporter small permease [Pseudonocardia thermophila]
MSRLSIALVVLAAAATVVLMVQVVADVVARNVFNSPIPATLELAQYYWMVLVVFGGLGYAQLRGEHVRATVLTHRLPASWQRATEVSALVLMAGFAALVAAYGWGEAVESTAIRETAAASSVLVWPMHWAVPVGAAALALQALVSVHLVLTRPQASRDRRQQEEPAR